MALPPVSTPPKSSHAAVPDESLSANIRPLGQLDESFIIATDDEGLLLIDQHVAHERVLFDKYRALGSGATQRVAAVAGARDIRSDAGAGGSLRRSRSGVGELWI